MGAFLGYGLCFAETLVIILGDYFIKLAADRDLALTSPQFLAGCALYALSAVGWYLAMQQISLSQVGVAFSMFTLLALCALGVVVFGETLRPRELLGIAMALGARVLMARFV